MSLITTFLLFLFFPTSFSSRTTPRPPVISPGPPSTIERHSDFENFLDSEKGGQVSGISEVKKYMQRFGYLDVENMNLTDEFDARFERAIATYQSNLGLAVTGKLDSDTISQMKLPRCGVHDKTPSKNLHASRRFNYFTGKPRWSRTVPMTLTYAFSPKDMISNLKVSEIRPVFRRAFSRWSAVIPVNFTEDQDYGFSDIKIGFFKGDHEDGEPFDGVLGVLAHGFSPESGKLHLDAAETWAVDFGQEKSGVAVDLESVATHEIGHLLGLSHSSNEEAVMYPSLKPREKKLDLTVDDIQGIQALYGSNPNFNLQSLSESVTSSNHEIGLKKMRVRSSRWSTIAMVVIAGLYYC